MNAANCLKWVKEFGTTELADLRTSVHVVEWLADNAKEACRDEWEFLLCDHVKALHIVWRRHLTNSTSST